MVRTVTLLAALLLAGASTLTAEVEPVELTVHESAAAGGKSVPVTTGLPIAKGVLKSTDSVLVMDEKGTLLPAQVGILSRWWNDGSIRAIVLDFQADLDAEGRARMKVALDADGGAPAPKQAVKAAKTDDGVTLDSGPLQLVVSKSSPSALKQVVVDGKAMLRDAPGGLRLKAGDKVYGEKAEGRRIEVEEEGPMRSAVKVTGILQAEGDERKFEYVSRFSVCAGERTLLFITAFRYLTFPYDHLANRKARVASERETDVALGEWGWNIPYVAGTSNVFAAGIRDAAMLKTTSFETGPDEARVVFWKKPDDAPDFVIRGGFASRYHHVVLAFADSAEEAGKLVASRLAPVRSFASPDYYCSAGWVETAPRRPGKHEPFENIVDRWFERVMKDTPMQGEWHFGDTSLWALPPYKHLAYGMGQDLGHPFAVMFMRTGERRYFDFLDAFARHVRVDNTVREMQNQDGITCCLPWSSNNWHIAYYAQKQVQDRMQQNDMMDESCPPTGGGCMGLPRINAWGIYDHYILTGDRTSLKTGNLFSNYALAAGRMGLGGIHADNGRAFRNLLLMLAVRYRVTGDEEAKAAILKFIEHFTKAPFIEKEKTSAYISPYGDKSVPAKNQEFAWTVFLESPGIVRGLNAFIDDTGSEEARAYLLDLMKRNWDFLETYTPDVIAELNAGKAERKSFHRWAMIAPALAQTYRHSGDKVWLDRAAKAWVASCADMDVAKSVTFSYNNKLDYWGYSLYAEYGVEYLPFLEPKGD